MPACWPGRKLIAFILLPASLATILVYADTARPQDNNLSEGEDTVSNVLVIHSYNPEFFWTKEIKEGIDQGFEQSNQKTVVFHEFLDAKRYPELHHKDYFLEGIRQKYQYTDLDLLMVADDPGLNLVLQVHEDFFVDLPVVFMGINNIQEKFLNKPWLTGVFETHSVAETILEAKRQTGANDLIVVTDSSETGEANRERVMSLEGAVESPKTFHFVKDITFSEVELRLGSYPDNWPIFVAGQLRNESSRGPLISFDEGAEIIHASVPNPIYTETRKLVGLGTIGGKVLDGNYHAQQAVQLAEEVLSGVSPDQVEPILKAKNQWIFDAAEMKRANISIANLPSDSILINERESFYEQNPELVWSTIFLLGGSFITIAVLSNAIRRQKSAEAQLRSNEKQLEQKVYGRTAELQDALNALQQSKSETEERSIELAKKNSELEIARLSADDANQAKSDFLAKMSHELRTPLNSILGYTQLLQRDQRLLVKHEDYLGTISSSGSHLLNLINNILDLSKVEAGKLDLNKRDFDVKALLESVFQMLGSEATRKGILFSYQCKPDFPEYIFQDESKCKQILINILGNAIKFTSCGQVSLVAEVLSANQLKFVISDTGPGISPQDLEHLFNPFSQASGEALHGRGTGLGLSISEEFVKLMGGRIDVESEQEKGSIFTILIPFESANSQVNNDSVPSLKSIFKLSTYTGQHRILIVDDDKPSRAFFRDFLNVSGFDLKTAASGEEAIALSHEWHPHAILMDVQMVGISGIEATETIKRVVKPSPIIIMLTTDTQVKTKHAAIAAGCDGFLNKPCSIEDLLQTLAEQLHLQVIEEHSQSSHSEALATEVALASTVMTSDLSESLAMLPQALLQRLAVAASSLSHTNLENVLDDFPEGHESLKAHLSNLKTDFRYDLILKMLEPHLPSGSDNAI